jgi:SAM-dependent methyltransferase
MSAAPTAIFPWFGCLPRIGTAEEFAALRRLFDQAGYNLEAIRRRLKVESLRDYSKPHPGGRLIVDALDALIALFFECGFVDEGKLTAVLPLGSASLLDRMGLLARDPQHPGQVFAPAAILPAFGFLTLCDRVCGPDGVRRGVPSDVVYPPAFQTTESFIAELPDTPCDAFLDLGTGAGTAALLGARNARHVWAADVLPRAAHFAEFNRALAGIGNLTVAAGDLYAPVEGLTFDRIVIHPPYVPAKQLKHVFADAGDDGEVIIRRAIEGLPQFLRPGGRFYSLQVATDRGSETFEQRIRKWLGDSEDEFDIILGVHVSRTPLEFLATGELLGRMTLDASRDWIDLWDKTGAKFMVYATVLIERHDAPRDALTTRVHKGEGYTGRSLEWLLDWRKFTGSPGHVEKLLSIRPNVSPDLTLRVVRRLHDGGFREEEFRLEIPGPFRTSFRCAEWLIRVLPDCRGVKTWQEHFDSAKSGGLIDEDVSADDFARLLGQLVASGVLLA